MPKKAKEKRMRQHQIEAQAELLSERFGVEAQAVTEVLNEYWSDQIADVWHIDDVKEQNPSLTDDQAREVLDCVMDTHDANYGINWEILDVNIRALFGTT
jgi:hypothetical protein